MVFFHKMTQDVSFQCYDKYLMKSLSKAAEVRGHSFWGRGPENAGSYNSAPHEIGFFRDGGDYDSYYGRFFLNWYSQVLIDHGDRVLALANLAFEGTGISAKVSYHCMESCSSLDKQVFISWNYR
jgi:beta-amylase